MGTTSRGYPTPEGSDNVDIPGDLSALASAINTDVQAVDTAKAAKATTITAGTGLTGGGDLSANRTLAVSYGTTAGTAAQGNDARITGAVQSSLVDAKGDLYVGTADNTVERLAAPADGRVLVADSTQTAGWTSAAMGNLLRPNVATGTDTLGDTTGISTSGLATKESSTDYAWQGTRSLKCTGGASNNSVGLAGYTNAATGGVAVTGGQTYTFAFYMYAPTIVRSIAARIYWWKADGSAASTASSSGPNLSLSAAWVRNSLTVVAPADAATATLVAVAGSVITGEVYYLDGVTFHAGAGGLWAPPGVPVPNLGTRANPADATQVQLWNPGNSTWITV